MKDSLSRFAPLAFWALMLSLAFAQENAVKPSPLADVPTKETQGLTLTFSAGGKTDTRGARLEDLRFRSVPSEGLAKLSAELETTSLSSEAREASSPSA